jgi:hypothetical protein
VVGYNTQLAVDAKNKLIAAVYSYQMDFTGQA